MRVIWVNGIWLATYSANNPFIILYLIYSLSPENEWRLGVFFSKTWGKKRRIDCSANYIFANRILNNISLTILRNKAYSVCFYQCMKYVSVYVLCSRYFSLKSNASFHDVVLYPLESLCAHDYFVCIFTCYSLENLCNSQILCDKSWK